MNNLLYGIIRDSVCIVHVHMCVHVCAFICLSLFDDLPVVLWLVLASFTTHTNSCVLVLC